METIKKNQTIELDVNPRHLSMVKEILGKLIPMKTVWVYGSRIKGTAKKSSDLDLVVFGVNSSQFFELKEAFDESDIPFRVDLMDWNKIPESFQKNILQKYFVLQEYPYAET